MASYRIVLVNHHAPLREGLKRILEEEPDLKVVGEEGDRIYKLKAVQSGAKVLAPSM
jgi:DNA-binding NarL/FixJ family response regulator